MLRVVVTGLQERFAAIIKAGPLQCRRLLRAVPAGGVFLRTNGMVGDAVGTVAVFKRIDHAWRQNRVFETSHCKTPGEVRIEITAFLVKYTSIQNKYKNQPHSTSMRKSNKISPQKLVEKTFVC